ncbi:hypothetical protein GTA08_BOTSDO05738 [Neofusicoccum parvum]|nr:hypothetical protein GTA08_BOTSDO05738 [Neofusicoccum parvum]
MASTPAPPERIHTPPPPLHGTRYDDWEPYSPPRRSSRVAAQRSKHSLDQQPHGLEPSKKRPAPRSARAMTPVGSSKQAAPAVSFTSSPPASPTSPLKRSAAKKGAQKTRLEEFLSSDTDSDPFVTSSKGSFGVLPTPSKTPSRKDKARPLSAFASAARVLFHDRPATIDEAMPSPRKSRKNKKHAAFTLPSFIDECDDENESIQIYTDFRERVPSFDDEEDNPFITKKPDENDEPNAGPSSSPRVIKRRMTKEEDEMERRARNGEGFVQVFRGKKIFTEFTNNSDDSGSEPDSPLGGSPVRRAAGVMARRRVTRSSIQPRLLFPSEEQKRAREAAAAAEAAEEDSTDIDASVQLATPRKRAHTARAPRSVPAEARDTTPEPTVQNTTKPPATTSTPATQRFFELATPPPSRTTRASAKKDTHVEPPPDPFVVEAGPSTSTSAQNGEHMTKPMFEPITRPTKRSPFDQWRRTKAGARSVSGTKREGESLEAAPAKRTRSAAHSTTPTAG